MGMVVGVDVRVVVVPASLVVVEASVVAACVVLADEPVEQPATNKTVAATRAIARPDPGSLVICVTSPPARDLTHDGLSNGSVRPLRTVSLPGPHPIDTAAPES
jgi:hypothetical protein